MKLRPETIAAHQARHQRERQDKPAQLRCDTARRFADACPRCKGVHMSASDAKHCRQANANHEQY